MLFVPAQIPHALHVPIIGPVYFVLPKSDDGGGENARHLSGLLAAHHFVPLPIVLNGLSDGNAVSGSAPDEGDKQEYGQKFSHGPIIKHES